jgi:hypothetical protein
VTPLVRLRRHTDGRLAVFRDGMWLITSVPPVTSYPSWFHDDRLCSGDGWSELLVAELPEPDATLSRPAQLWALLHNSCSPEGRWTEESRRYYTQIAAVFDRDRTPTQDAYDAACVALHKHRTRADRLEAVLAELVALKDGPRDDRYRSNKDAAWGRARHALAAVAVCDRYRASREPEGTLA